MNEVLEKIQKIGIVPVVVLNDAKDAAPLAKALCDGGLPCAEVTFRTEAAEESIRIMAEQFPQMLVGAGTVLTTEQVDRAVAYEPADAVALAKKTAVAKFDETIEVHIRTGCDGRHAEQQIRGAVVLPNGTGKTVKVLVFAKGDKVNEAEAAGADYVGGDELIPKIQNDGWLDFDVVVATPDMMGVVGRLGKVLGPKGLMPNPKAGTVTMDVTKAVNDIKAGKIEYRLDKANIIHVPIGKASFSEEKLQENFNALMDAIVKARPSALKGQYLKSITLTSTMGPGVKVSVAKF